MQRSPTRRGRKIGRAFEEQGDLQRSPFRDRLTSGAWDDRRASGGRCRRRG